MAEKPSTLPTWATDGGTTLEPSAGEKAAGFSASTRAPARWINWILNTLYQWMQYLNDPVGTGAGAGMAATGGSTSGSGFKGTGGAPNGIGHEGIGTGTGAGVKGTGGSTSGSGVEGTGGATNGVGVKGQGTGSGSGVQGTGGATSGAAGVEGTGGSTNGVGGKFTGTGTGEGVHGTGVNGYGAVAESDTTSPAKAALRIVPQNADPATAPAAGDTYVHSTSGRESVYDGSLWGRIVSRINAATSAAAMTMLSGDTAKTLLTYTIPSNLKAGTTVRIRMGILTNNNTAATSYSIVIDGQYPGLNDAFAVAAGYQMHVIDLELTFRTVGATGTLAVVGRIDAVNGSTGMTTNPLVWTLSNVNTTDGVPVAIYATKAAGQPLTCSCELLTVDISD